MSKTFKSYLGEDVAYNIISSMVEESKFCTVIMKNHFNKEIVMTKEDDEDLKALPNAGIVIMIMLQVLLR